MTILALHYATKDCLNYVPFTERALSFAYKVFVLIYIYYIYCGNNCSIQYIPPSTEGVYNTYIVIHLLKEILIYRLISQIEVNAVIINSIQNMLQWTEMEFYSLINMRNLLVLKRADWCDSNPQAF